MALEKVTSNLRELNFYGGGKAADINLGYAITSLRNPRPDYNFHQKEVIMAKCQDDGESIRVIVISNEKKPLKDHPTPVLALDGFFSAEHAAEGMRNGGYPGYENTTIESPMHAITFLKDASYMALSLNLKTDLLNQPIEKSLKTKEFRHLFFPTMCQHLTNMGCDIKEWADFLCDFNSLISVEECEAMENFSVADTNVFDLVKENPEMLQKILRTPNHPYFKPLILAQFD